MSWVVGGKSLVSVTGRSKQFFSQCRGSLEASLKSVSLVVKTVTRKRGQQSVGEDIVTEQVHDSGQEGDTIG